MSDGIESSTADLLRDAYTRQGGNELTDDPAVKALLALYARTQYALYVAFQILVVALTVLVVTALAVAVVRLLNGVDAATVVAGLGSLVSGGATAFLNKQANDAKGRYLEAMTMFREG